MHKFCLWHRLLQVPLYCLIFYYKKVFEVFNDNRELMALKVVDLSDLRVRDELIKEVHFLKKLRMCPRVIKWVVLTHKCHFWLTQCDQIGRFLKVLSDIFSDKSSPNIWQLFGLCWKMYLCTVPRFWATVNSNIWSHCFWDVSPNIVQSTCLIGKLWNFYILCLPLAEKPKS